MTFSFHPEAESEFHEAIDYYEDCERGLGYDFSIEVLATIQNIVNYPTAWPVIEEEVRRCLVNRFPYGVIYSMEQDEIFILAVMHLRRHPDCWKTDIEMAEKVGPLILLENFDFDCFILFSRF